MPEARRRLADKGTEKRPWGWNEVGDCREMDPGRLEKSLPSWAHLLPVALNLRASLLAPITLGSGATRSCELHFLSSMLSKVLVAQMVGICLQCRRASFDPWIRKIPGGGNGYPLQYSCLENPIGREAQWATDHEVAKSPTWLSD